LPRLIGQIGPKFACFQQNLPVSSCRFQKIKTVCAYESEKMSTLFKVCPGRWIKPQTLLINRLAMANLLFCFFSSFACEPVKLAVGRRRKTVLALIVGGVHFEGKKIGFSLKYKQKTKKNEPENRFGLFLPVFCLYFKKKPMLSHSVGTYQTM